MYRAKKDVYRSSLALFCRFFFSVHDCAAHGNKHIESSSLFKACFVRKIKVALAAILIIIISVYSPECAAYTYRLNYKNPAEEKIPRLIYKQRNFQPIKQDFHFSRIQSARAAYTPQRRSIRNKTNIHQQAERKRKLPSFCLL